MRNLFNPRPCDEYITDAAPEPAAPAKKKTGIAKLWGHTIKATRITYSDSFYYGGLPQPEGSITARIVHQAAELANLVIAVEALAMELQKRTVEAGKVPQVERLWNMTVEEARDLLERMKCRDDWGRLDTALGIFADAASLSHKVEAVDAAYRALREEREKEDINV